MCCIAILLNMACFLFSVCLEPFDYTQSSVIKTRRLTQYTRMWDGLRGVAKHITYAPQYDYDRHVEILIPTKTPRFRKSGAVGRVFQSLDRVRVGEVAGKEAGKFRVGETRGWHDHTKRHSMRVPFF